MNQDNKPKKQRIKMVSISLEELKSCPKLILSRSHWYPVHKVEECGTNEKKTKVKIEVKPKVNQSIKKLHPKKCIKIIKILRKLVCSAKDNSFGLRANSIL